MVTIFTPVYNREKTLKRLYQSLLFQTVKDFEWLVINDGSTDGSDHLIKQFVLEKKLNIKYISKQNE